MYSIRKAIFKSVFRVAIRPFGSPSDFLEIGCILGNCFSSLAELDELLLGLGDIVTCLGSSVESFNEGCPCRGEWKTVVGALVVRFNRLEVGDSPQSSISF